MPRRLLFLLPLLALGCGQTPQPAPSGQQPAPPTLEVKAPPTTMRSGKGINYLPMTCDQLVDKWRENPSAADAAWVGNPNGVEFVGKLAAITANDANQTIAVIVPENATDLDRQVIVGAVSDFTRGTLNKFKIGDVVRVKGTSFGATQPTPCLTAWVFEPVK